MATPEETGKATFEIASDMETETCTAKDLMKALAMIAETLDPDEGSVVQRLAWMAIIEIDKIEVARCQIFTLTHRYAFPAAQKA